MQTRTAPLPRMARRFSDARQGATAAGIAVALPLILLLALGLLEFGLIVYDYHLASRAAQRAIHKAITSPPLANLAALSAAPVSCGGKRRTVVCTGAAVRDDATETFAGILNAVRDVFPNARPENLRVVYSTSGLGSAATPGIVTPIITIDLVDLTHDFAVLGTVPVLPSGITFAPFSSTALGASQTFP